MHKTTNILGGQQFADVLNTKLFQMAHLKLNSSRQECEHVVICDDDITSVDIPATVRTNRKYYTLVNKFPSSLLGPIQSNDTYGTQL